MNNGVAAMTTDHAARLARFAAIAAERRAAREAAKVRNAADKARKAAAAMTCQCCGRAIFAETGTIAHHGYQRPAGWHAQTASCMGAKQLPFEVSRDRLGEMIRGIESHLAHLRAALARVQADAQPLSFEYTARREYGANRPRFPRYVAVTRETFDDVRAAYENEMRTRGVRSFDDIKASAVSSLESSIRNTESDRKLHQARFDGWKQTHRREGDKWMAL